MGLDFFKEQGIGLEQQHDLRWKDIVGLPFRKHDDDGFSRVRALLLSGIEAQALRFQHRLARNATELRPLLARTRRVEQFQQTAVHWLLPFDPTPLETALVHEHVAVELTASLAAQEPDPYLARVMRVGLLDDFDHLCRHSELLERLEGKDAGPSLPPGATSPNSSFDVDHRVSPRPQRQVGPLSKLDALLLLGVKQQTRDDYLNTGPELADPQARLLFASIASVEEQHVSRYAALLDPGESWLELWLLHEASEVHGYHSCLLSEGNPRLRRIWEHFCNCELGHLQQAMKIFREVERRDPAEVLPACLPEPIRFGGHREFVRRTLEQEVELRAEGFRFLDRPEELPGNPPVRFRQRLDREVPPPLAPADRHRSRA